MKRPNRKVQTKRIKLSLDKESKTIAKLRDGYTCVMCGSKDNLHSHHWLVHKSHSQRLAYEPDNLATVCYSCHIIKIHQRGDGLFVMGLAKRMTEIVGSDRVSELEEISAHPIPLKLEDFQDMLAELRGRETPL